MSRISYTRAPDVCRIVELLVKALPELGYIDTGRVYCVRSRGAKTNAIARIHGMPRIWQEVLGIRPAYVIEVVSEHYDSLSLEEKIKVVIHELLHIPRTFSGALRPHGPYVNQRRVRTLYREAKRRGVVEEAKKALNT